MVLLRPAANSDEEWCDRIGSVVAVSSSAKLDFLLKVYDYLFNDNNNIVSKFIPFETKFRKRNYGRNRLCTALKLSRYEPIFSLFCDHFVLLVQ